MVEIVPYQASWPHDFQVIAANLRQEFRDLALRIDHIGSTSVPGLAAKDVIDIQLTVATFEGPLITTMAAMGYPVPKDVSHDHAPPDFTGPATEWEKLFFRAPDGHRRTHIHVRIQGRANQRYPLLFRDYLRANSATAEAYAELKRRLAQHLADPRTYPDVKDPAVDLIFFAAEEWATFHHWQPGPSDG